MHPRRLRDLVRMLLPSKATVVFSIFYLCQALVGLKLYKNNQCMQALSGTLSLANK